MTSGFKPFAATMVSEACSICASRHGHPWAQRERHYGQPGDAALLALGMLSGQHQYVFPVFCLHANLLLSRVAAVVLTPYGMCATWHNFSSFAVVLLAVVAMVVFGGFAAISDRVCSRTELLSKLLGLPKTWPVRRVSPNGNFRRGRAQTPSITSDEVRCVYGGTTSCRNGARDVVVPTTMLVIIFVGGLVIIQ